MASGGSFAQLHKAGHWVWRWRLWRPWPPFPSRHRVMKDWADRGNRGGISLILSVREAKSLLGVWVCFGSYSPIRVKRAGPQRQLLAKTAQIINSADRTRRREPRQKCKCG